MNTTPAPSPVTRREYLGYAFGDTASCLYFQTFSTFLLIFYTDTFGLAPAVVSTMFLVTRSWDAVTDPIMGMIADRTETRHGKFRPWILWGIIPFMFTGVLVFITPDLPAQGKTVYAYVTYSLVMLAYTMVNVPYGALLGVISPKSEERTMLASSRFVGAFVGNIFVLGTLLYLVRWFGRGNDRLGYPLAIAVLAVLAGILFFITFNSTRERIRPPPTSGAIGRDLGDLLRNRPWLVLSLAALITLICLSVRNGAMLY
ncbi:MAG: MFS transporter [Opitutae bacterium]|nr:MFS transporter [Opitutae bacterium]